MRGADALDFDYLAVLQVKLCAQQVCRTGADAHAAAHAGRFHAAGDVYRVPPHIISKLADANHTGHNRPAVDAHADFKVGALRPVEGLDRLEHLKPHVGHRLRMVCAGLRHPAHQHEIIANRLDFFQPAAFRYQVKRGHHFIQKAHQVRRTGCARELGERHQVGEQHRYAIVAVCNQLLAKLEPVGNKLRQNVGQQALCFFLFGQHQFMLAAQLLHAQLVQVAQFLFFNGGGGARAQQHRAEGLGQIVLRPQLNAFDRVGDVFTAGNYNYRQPVNGSISAHGGQHFHAGHLGHFHVQQHQVEGLGFDAFNGCAAVGSLGNILEAQLLERANDAHAHHFAVINHQHPRRKYLLRAGRLVHGRSGCGCRGPKQK